ncbi:hypothetical protein Bhyg_09118 [Pseudolycoriella hygida]|uniref:Vitellogenin domain-containing protein n=1 Tax=Pseudolycoriella hygida TaxID=35572 RepID=A0A9Q0N5Y7_9DIPT|nr:hypothetical protein Bhyg_09118 [Pseudolycoriella hygida]
MIFLRLRSDSFLWFLVSLGLAVAFVQFEDDKEYEFYFKSKFVLAPEELEGGQNVTATILVKKFGRDSLIFRIKDSTFVGANVHAKSRSDIEGTFGVKRNVENGAITHVISKSTRDMEILCKKMIVDMLSENLSFFESYARNYVAMKGRWQHRVKLAVGWCDADVTAAADTENNLVEVLAQSQKTDCDIDPVILQAGQLLMHGTTAQIGRTLDSSKFGMSVFFDVNTGKIVEVSKFTFINLEVVGVDIQARHNMLVEYVGERPISRELNFQPPYISYSKEHIDEYVLTHK